MLFLGSVLAIPVTMQVSSSTVTKTTLSAATTTMTTMQVSLAFSWLYFHMDNSFFSAANIHFIPEVKQSTPSHELLSPGRDTERGHGVLHHPADGARRLHHPPFRLWGPPPQATDHLGPRIHKQGAVLGGRFNLKFVSLVSKVSCSK